MDQRSQYMRAAYALGKYFVIASNIHTHKHTDKVHLSRSMLLFLYFNTLLFGLQGKLIVMEGVFEILMQRNMFSVGRTYHPSTLNNEDFIPGM